MTKRIPCYAAILASVAVGQRATHWTTEQALQVQLVDAARPSPDGRLVVYTQTRQIIEPEKSESNTQVWLALADGSRRFELTRGEKSSSNPPSLPT